MSTGPSLFSSLSASLRSPNPSLPPLAAATLYSLLTVDAYRPIIGSKHQLISSLISLLFLTSSTSASASRTQTQTRTLKDSLKALFALSLYPLNRPVLVSLDAVPALFLILLRDTRIGIMEDTSAVISQVAGCYECVDAFRKVGGVRVLVGMMIVGSGSASASDVSERVRENAASALLNLAMSGGDKAVGDIREVEAAEVVVQEMAEKGKSERGKRKAAELLSVLLRSARRHHHPQFHLFNSTTTTSEGEDSSLLRCSSSRSSNNSSSVASSSF